MTREEAAVVIENDVYELLPCTASNQPEVEALDMAIQALSPVTREQVEKVWRGEWVLWSNDDDTGMDYVCSMCRFSLNEDLFYAGYKGGKWIENDVFWFCPRCGAPMTDEAVEMVMKRLEALHEDNS